MKLRWQHKARAKRTVEAGRNSTVMVARLLGVDDSRVRRWIEIGMLQARHYNHDSLGYWVIDDNDLRAFLEGAGATQECVQPTDPHMRKLVALCRVKFHNEFVSATDVCNLLGVSRSHINKHLKKRLGFPSMVYYNHSNGGNFYRKRDIVSWLNEHPQYDCSGRRREQLRMYLNGGAYLITMSRTSVGEGGHFIVWDEMDGRPLMKVDHRPIQDEHGTTVGVLLMGETKDDIHVESRWMAYDRRNSEVHGYHSFILEVGCLVGRAHEMRTRRAEVEHEPT